jgi:site-specific DNA-methyltransferase (adenine-specific)
MLKPFYQAGGITIYHGDALDVLRRLPDRSAAMLLTDPPYSSGGLHLGAKTADPAKKYQNGGTLKKYPAFKGDNRDQLSWLYWSALWLARAAEVCADGALAFVFSDWRQTPAASVSLQAGGWIWRGTAVWDKTQACRPFLGGLRQQAEFIVWGSNGPVKNRKGTRPGVVSRRVDPAQKRHVNGKPLDVILNLAQLCPPGGLILDPFMGAGTTLVAAARLGLPAVGIDHEKTFCQTAADWLDDELPLLEGAANAE